MAIRYSRGSIFIDKNNNNKVIEIEYENGYYVVIKGNNYETSKGKLSRLTKIEASKDDIQMLKDRNKLVLIIIDLEKTYETYYQKYQNDLINKSFAAMIDQLKNELENIKPVYTEI